MCGREGGWWWGVYGGGARLCVCVCVCLCVCVCVCVGEGGYVCSERHVHSMINSVFGMRAASSHVGETTGRLKERKSGYVREVEGACRTARCTFASFLLGAGSGHVWESDNEAEEFLQATRKTKASECQFFERLDEMGKCDSR